MTQHTIAVDVGYGLEHIEVDDRLLVQLRLAAGKARLAREKEAADRLKEAFKTVADAASGWHFVGFTGGNGTFSFGPAGSAPPNPHFRGHTAEQAWLDDEQWEAAKEPAPEPSRPDTPRTVNEALAVLRHYLGGDTQMFSDTSRLRRDIRRAKRTTHPDTGGAAADFQLVTAAEDILRSAHRI